MRMIMGAGAIMVAAGLGAWTIVLAGEYIEVPDHVANCLRCHDGSSEHPVLEIFASPHAVLADPHTRFATEGCAACHGDSLAHARFPAPAGGEPAEIAFRGEHRSSTETINQTCMNCHAGADMMHWHGSAHDFEELACVDCHTIHTRADPAMDQRGQIETCTSCHVEQHAQMHRAFAHPVREGQVACTDCHNPHGGIGPSDLTTMTVNENCYGCHAEKRGPFLWEHQPVREDCTLCHQPHGSVHRDLLVQRTPFLCQQCHMGQFHPSTVQSGTGLPGEGMPSGSRSLLGRDCMNCHVQVHGSNHPSGVGQTR